MAEEEVILEAEGLTKEFAAGATPMVVRSTFRSASDIAVTMPAPFHAPPLRPDLINPATPL